MNLIQFYDADGARAVASVENGAARTVNGVAPLKALLA